jgi:phenylalanyl-tRNA synthetase beta chain
MHVSDRWLRTLAPTLRGSPAELAAQLTALGVPVDAVVPLATGFEDIVVARVRRLRPHPNADRLRIAEVDVGDGVLRQVVTGAANVREGGSYPFVPAGGRLPDGRTIRGARLRGEWSEGMLCSEEELGLGRDAEGLMELVDPPPPGTPVAVALGLDDVRYVLEVTPNRGDLLSHWGVARELAPGGDADLVLPPVGEPPQAAWCLGEGRGAAGPVRVEVEDAGDCPQYLAAVVTDVVVGPSPTWLAQRLRAVGLRPINNVVDVTNYVLYELGQPLHAFDLARLAGPMLLVRRARAGERLVTLDGVERRLDSEILVIADADGPVAVAGVMGGAATAVRPETTAVVLECAEFAPARVRRAARGLGLATDAAQRFERGVDAGGLERALRRALELLLATAGGQVAEPLLRLGRAPAPRALTLRAERARRVLGVGFEPRTMAAVLAPLGFAPRPEAGEVRVQVPLWRADVQEEIDLVEEVARRWGYDRFPAELAPFRPSAVLEDPQVEVERRLRRWGLRWGLMEARTAAFAPPAPHRVALPHPLSQEESHLRDSVAGGLVRRLAYNAARGVRHVRLFELGTAFQRNGDAIGEERRLGVLVFGDRMPRHWSGPSEPWSFWDVKGMAEELAAAWGLEWGEGIPTPPELDDDLRVAARNAAGTVWVVAGRLRPDAWDRPAWAGEAWVLEARPPTTWPADERRYRPLPEFPAVERDLALVVPDELPAARVEALLRQVAGKHLEALFPFDVYRGPHVPAGHRSIAWRLRFRAPDRTLTDDEVERAVSAALRRLEEELGVRRR